MKSAGAILGLVIALAIGYFVYKAEFARGPEGGAPPQEQIDTAGVTSDLVSIGQAERLYLAGHGSYATLDQLQQDGDITFSGANRRGYNYTAEVDDGQHFKVTAVPTDPAKAGWPTFTVDETMQVTRQ
ncbi:MAG TPA: hypothetical protein VGW33_13690 [Terriglobia bacterium]|nr:hypothetical protein [Terriglobia bacterium]